MRRAGLAAATAPAVPAASAPAAPPAAAPPALLLPPLLLPLVLLPLLLPLLLRRLHVLPALRRCGRCRRGRCCAALRRAAGAPHGALDGLLLLFAVLRGLKGATDRGCQRGLEEQQGQLDGWTADWPP